ncbi:MAK10-like protein [Tanacetum coccineum]
MGDVNPIRTLGYYSRTSNEGYRNTIKLPKGNNVVPLRSDTIWLVQYGYGCLCSNVGVCTLAVRLPAEDLALYDNESWNDPRDFAKPVKAISLPQDVPSTSDRRLIELENQVQRLMEAHLAPKQPIQVNKITSSCEICSGPHDTQYCMENPEQAFVEYASSRTDEAGVKKCYNETNYFQKDQSQPVTRIRTQPPEGPEQTLKDEFKDLHLNMPVLEVLAHALMYNVILDKYITNLELGKNGSAFIQGEMPKKMEDPGLFTLPYGTKSYPIGIVKDIEVHIRRLKLLNDFYLIDMKKDPETPLLVGREDCPLPEEWEIARDADINPFKDVLNPINWDKPLKTRDGAWHAKIRLIDPDGEEFTKTLQSIPTLENSSKGRIQGRSSTWITFITPKDVKVFKKNKEKIFTMAGDDVRIIPDGVTPPAICCNARGGRRNGVFISAVIESSDGRVHITYNITGPKLRYYVYQKLCSSSSQNPNESRKKRYVSLELIIICKTLSNGVTLPVEKFLETYNDHSDTEIVITEYLGMNLENMGVEMLRACKKVTISKDDIVVLDGAGDKKAIEE